MPILMWHMQICSKNQFNMIQVNIVIIFCSLLVHSMSQLYQILALHTSSSRPQISSVFDDKGEWFHNKTNNVAFVPVEIRSVLVGIIQSNLCCSHWIAKDVFKHNLCGQRRLSQIIRGNAILVIL